MNDNKFSSKKLKMSILLGAIAVAAISIFAAILYSQGTLNVRSEVQTQDEAVLESVPGAPPIELSEYGSETAKFEDAKTAGRIDNANLPTYVPAGFELESIRTKVQEDKEGNMHNLITIIYTESGKQTTDSDDFRKIIENGAVVILYVKDSSYLDPDFDWQKQVQMSVDEEPDIRSKVTINGYTALLIKGTPDYWLTAKAKVMQDGTLVEILTAKHDTSELERMLQTMLA